MLVDTRSGTRIDGKVRRPPQLQFIDILLVNPQRRVPLIMLEFHLEEGDRVRHDELVVSLPAQMPLGKGC